jgi:hypothetical protein
MTVKIFVARDDKGNEWAPDTVHEVSSLEWMLKKVWQEFHHLPTLYCIIANLRFPSADVVVFTERGLGVLELKHSKGDISIDSDGIWLANRQPIKAGIHLNPQKQVQHYAKEIREKLIPTILPAELQRDRPRWNDFKFQTGVCFTNPAANFSGLKQKVADKRPAPWPEWESAFSIIGPDEFTSWIRELRFQVNEGYAKKFQPVRLSPFMMLQTVQRFFSAVEWREMLAAMPEGDAYAYLILDDEQGRQVFNLHKDQNVIGRNPDCDIVIPERYSKVSKQHCKINRNINQIFISDMDSTNGTYINGKFLSANEQNYVITHETDLTLGGPVATEKICRLTLELREKTTIKPPSTEVDEIRKSTN